MKKEYKIKSFEMISPKYKTTFGILDGTIEEFEFPYGVNEVRDFLKENTSLRKVILPETITKLESMCFYNCENLTIVEYKGTISQWNNISQGYGCFNYTGVTEINCIDGNISIEGV